MMGSPQCCPTEWSLWHSACKPRIGFPNCLTSGDQIAPGKNFLTTVWFQRVEFKAPASPPSPRVANPCNSESRCQLKDGSTTVQALFPSFEDVTLSTEAPHSFSNISNFVIRDGR